MVGLEIAAAIIRQNLAEVGMRGHGQARLLRGLVRGAGARALRPGMWFGDRGPAPYEFYRSQMDPRWAAGREKAVANFHRLGPEEAAGCCAGSRPR